MLKAALHWVSQSWTEFICLCSMDSFFLWVAWKWANFECIHYYNTVQVTLMYLCLFPPRILWLQLLICLKALQLLFEQKPFWSCYKFLLITGRCCSSVVKEGKVIMEDNQRYKVAPEILLNAWYFWASVLEVNCFVCNSNPFIHDNILSAIIRWQLFKRGNNCLARRMSFPVICGHREHFHFWAEQKLYCNTEFLLWWERKIRGSVMYLPHLGVWYRPESLWDSHIQGKIIFLGYMCCGSVF